MTCKDCGKDLTGRHQYARYCVHCSSTRNRKRATAAYTNRKGLPKRALRPWEIRNEMEYNWFTVAWIEGAETNEKIGYYGEKEKI